MAKRRPFLMFSLTVMTAVAGTVLASALAGPRAVEIGILLSLFLLPAAVCAALLEAMNGVDNRWIFLGSASVAGFPPAVFVAVSLYQSFFSLDNVAAAFSWGFSCWLVAGAASQLATVYLLGKRSYD